MKSTIKQLTNIDTSKAISIDRLHANQRLIQMHTKRLQEVFKNDTPEQINMKLQNVVARENVFNVIMTEVARNFEVTFDEEEVKVTTEKLKPQLPDQQPNVLLEMAKKIIIKSLIFDILAKEWNITITDDDVNNSLDQYYKMSNLSIREYKEDKNKFETIRSIMLEEKVANELIKKFINVKIDWETIKKHYDEAVAAKQTTTPEEPKKNN